MWKLWWPIILLVLASVGYQAGAKGSAEGMHPLAALVVTYFVAAILSVICYFVMEGKKSRVRDLFEFQPAALGLAFSIVAIEIGTICLYKAGWPVNLSFIVYNSIIVCVLLLMSYFVYHEKKLTPRQALGILVCGAGVGMIMM
jgi:uncharacterized membrane protein